MHGSVNFAQTVPKAFVGMQSAAIDVRGVSILRERSFKHQANSSCNESSDVFDSDHDGRCASTYVFFINLSPMLLREGMQRLKTACGRRASDDRRQHVYAHFDSY